MLGVYRNWIKAVSYTHLDVYKSQIFLGENADGDFRIEADVNLDATQEEGEVIFKNYRVGFVEDLAE